MAYENNFWKLLNVDELPKYEKGRYKGKINNEKCVGKILKYQNKNNKEIYNIEILDYTKDNKPKFKIKYIYLPNTKCEECIIKIIECSNLITQARVGGIIPSTNKWIEKDGYWVGSINKKNENMIFKFSTINKETEYNILHSSWVVGKGNYIITGNLNGYGKWSIHRAIYFNCNKEKSDININICIDHINNDIYDNRIENLRISTIKENSKNKNYDNKYGLTGLYCYKNKSYYSKFKYETIFLSTKYRKNKIEAELDNLIVQQYLGYKHNEDQFYRLNELSEDRIKEVTELLDKKIKDNKHKVKEQKECAYNYIEKDNLIGIITIKKDGTPNEICWVDRDFGRMEEDKYYVKGNLSMDKEGYFIINNNRLGKYILCRQIDLQNYKGYNFQIDHKNRKRNYNNKNNLEIVTIKSNAMNKDNKKYYKRKNKDKYEVKYARDWKYFDLYISGLKQPYFNTEEEAIIEYKRRKEIVNKYRFRAKTLEEVDEIIDFAEGHELDVDSAYIVWKGLDSLENIKNFLKTIDE